MIDKKAQPSTKPGAGSSSIKSRVDEAVLRLKEMKKAKPARLVTLKSSIKSSIKSWFKPALDQKELDALIKSLTDGKRIKVTGAKVAYSLG